MRSGSAVQYDRYGGFDVVEVVEIQRPEPGPGQIVVEIEAAGLNHVERFLREGKLTDHVDIAFPYRQGVDFAGIVRARGDGVRDLHVGDEVLGHAPGGGSHATWVCVPRTAVVKKPERVTFEVAGGLYLAGCTAMSIVDGLKLGKGDTVVVAAAAGGVGHIECQLARDAGAFVIGLGSARNHDALRQIGVSPVVYGPGEEARIREAADGRTITAFIDNHGDSDNAALATALGVDPGRFVSLEDRRDVEVRFLTAPGDDTEATDKLATLAAMIEQRRVQVLISGYYPFEFIVDAYEDLAQMHSRGKVVVGMQPVETGARLDWYRSEKSRDLRDPVS
jgi:NADPH:quinone reductase-like Zn-dependent oxidoreductase